MINKELNDLGSLNSVAAMNSRATPIVAPFFLDAEGGRRFCIQWSPPPGAPVRGGLVFAHAFGEEMNKSRRMVALQAIALATRGISTLGIDLKGCGDSSGDFTDADWEDWLADIKLASAYLRESLQCPVGLWGLRLGATLAAQVASSGPENYQRLILWQPVVSAQQHLTQFLRLKSAREMIAKAGRADSVDSLRRLLAAGTPVEVAGYMLTPRLAAQLDRQTLQDLETFGALEVHWMEVVSDAALPLAMVSEKVVQAWGQAGVNVNAHTALGEAFWATVEITECPNLIRATTGIFMKSDR